jgi:hypothetical protein
VADTAYGPDRHLEALGLSPNFTLEEARVVLRGLSERLEEERERQRAIEEQRRKKREEVTQARGGRVVADHGDAEEESLVEMHLNQFNYWGCGPRR